MKHLFERVSTSPVHHDIVQMFDEQVFERSEGDIVMSANAVMTGSYVERRPERRILTPVPQWSQGDVRSIDSAPSFQRRRAALIAESPSMRRKPACVGTRTSRHSSPVSVIAGVLAIIAVTAGGFWLGTLAQPSAYSGPTRTHSVTPGESVWSIAQGITGGSSLEQTVIDIETLNSLDGGLAVGERIVVPVY